MTYKPGRYAVDDVLHIDGTAAANPHSQLIIVSTATKRQRFQMKTFFLDQILIVTVVPHNLLSDEGLIFFYGAEVVTAPQYQRLTDTPFQMSVGTFNRAIFVAPTGIIVYALHSVVLTESSITLSQLAASIFALLFPCCPQAVRFMFYRHSAQLSEGFLQTFSQSREALTTQHNPHPAPVAPFQTEVIQLMRQQLTGACCLTS